VSVAGAPTVAAEPKARARSRARGVQRARVSFPELVYAHYLRQQALVNGQPYEGEAERRYRAFEQGFVERYGEIVSSYWSSSTASGAAVTVKLRPLIIPDHVRLHWATDWATRGSPELDGLRYECEALAVRITEVLRDTSQRVAIQWLFTVIGHVLGFAESGACNDKAQVERLVEAQRRELKRIQQYYEHAAQKSGQTVYLAGALLGIVPPVLLLGVALLFGIAHSTSDAVRTGFACFAAGAVGALVSVMARMNSGKTTLDWEFGKDTLRTGGLVRPFVGGVFGLATFFALKSDVVKIGAIGDSFYYLALFAFASGFSERLAQDMLLASTLGRVTPEKNPKEHPATATTTAEARPPDAAPAGHQPAG
jgi:hypothetical protein